MNWIVKTFSAYSLSLTALLSITTVVHAQNSATLAQAPSAIVVLDSTKTQDGLNGSVRRVKTESAKLGLSKGQIVEGPRQLIEVTTYDVTGKRVENISYPIASSSVGKEEYKYDERGNIIEMTMRGDGGAILSRENYNYEFDRFGNWTKMVTSVVVFEADELKREPVEVTYRSFTYYFDDNVAKITDAPSHGRTVATPLPGTPPIDSQKGEVRYETASGDLSLSKPITAAGFSAGRVEIGEPPPVANKSASVEKTDAAVSAENQSIQATDEKLSAVTASSPISFDSELEKKEAYMSVSPSIGEASLAPSVSASKGDPGATSRAEKNPPKVEPTNDVTAEKLAFEVYKKGRDLFDSGDAKGAVSLYLYSIQLMPTSAELQLSLGQAYLKLKKDKEASKAFKESLRLNPDSGESQYGLGLATFRMNRYRDAADAFKRAIQISPAMAKAHYGLALAYQELDNSKGVIEEYRLLERLDRDMAKQLARAFPAFDLPCHAGASCK